MLKLVILGSSAAVPSVGRGLPSLGIRHEGDVYLFDCGEGTQRQMMRSGLSYAKVKCIFVTHAHADHIVGIAGLAQTLELIGRREPLLIYCPAPAVRPIEALLSIGRYSYAVEVREAAEGVVHRGDGFAVSAFSVPHSCSAVGYAFKQDGRRNFNEAKCKRLGIKGRLFGELEKNGAITIGGERITYEAVSTAKRGKLMVYAGDCMPCEETIKAAKGADVLIHEATYANDHEKEAAEKKHSTAAQAAALAKKAKVKKLILTHVSGRYKDAGVLEKEARAIFKASQVASDGMEILLPD